MGPNLIIDKSFLQSLKPEELEELTLWFRVICVPTLVSEIIADLKLPAGSGRVPTAIVRALAQKMAGAPGFRPMQWRELAIAELRGQPVPMNGFTVPVDAAAHNVHVSDLGVMYDAGAEQRIWARWAAGDFNADEEEEASVWRAGIMASGPEDLVKTWRPFVEGQLGSPKTFSDLVAAIDAFMCDRSADAQLEVLRIALSEVGAPAAVQTMATDAFYAHPGSVLCDHYPYLASIVRLTMALKCGIPRGFVGGTTSLVDLQYLFYTPFCAALASSDKLHSALWPATTTDATFLWGPTLQSELAQRVEIRLELTSDGWEDWAAYRDPYGEHPPPLPGSLINRVYDPHSFLKVRPSNRRQSTLPISNLRFRI